MNVSGVLVQTRPEFIEEVVEHLQSFKGCDYHFHDKKGRIIITIEGEGVEEEIAKLQTIQKIPHVIAADMMYAYSEEELNSERDKIEIEGTKLPQWLHDNDTDLEAITYHGDLKKKF